MKQNILLHACCGPCATTAIERLKSEGYSPAVFYPNSNIISRAEWEKRLDSLVRVCRSMNVSLEAAGYDHDSWLEAVCGLENEPEKGRRCLNCFRLNLERTSAMAAEMGIGQITTSLTTSPYKPVPMLESAGKDLDRFLLFDFKKKDGYLRSITLSKELELYRQDFCGCEFSCR